MSVNNLTVEGEFRYIVQWFNEWSELQRDDFLPILVEYIKGNSVYMNGIVSDLAASTCNDKPPMSLFQCRIKLFKEWSPKWPGDMKINLKEKVFELDPKFGEKLEEELSTLLTNGTSSPIPPQVQPPIVEVVVAPPVVDDEPPPPLAEAVVPVVEEVLQNA